MMTMLTLKSSSKEYPYKIQFFNDIGAAYTYYADSAGEFLLQSYFLSYYHYDGQVGEESIFEQIGSVSWEKSYEHLAESVSTFYGNSTSFEAQDIDQYYQNQFMQFTPSNADLQLVEKIYAVYPHLEDWPRMFEGFSFEHAWDDLLKVLETPGIDTLLSLSTLQTIMTEPKHHIEVEMHL